MDYSKNYYKILKTGVDSTDAEIKRSYKELVKKYHPDRNEFPEAVKMFQLVQEAYDALSTDRANYDKNCLHFKPTIRHDGLNIIATIHRRGENLIEYEHLTFCKSCDGTGFDTESESHKCHRCDGGLNSFNNICYFCKGEGKVYEKRCDTCNGNGISKYKNSFSLMVLEPSVLKNRGNRSIDQKVGDFIIHTIF